MKGYRAEDLRAFTQALFVGSCFDSFLLQEAEFRTFCTFSIDGTSHRSWYTDEELEEQQIEEYTTWGKLKPVCFQLIRGKRTPQSFHLTLRLSPGEQERLLPETAQKPNAEPGTFFLNLRFEKKELHCVSLASFRLFPPDRSLEDWWDAWLRNFFEKNGLVVSQL